MLQLYSRSLQTQNVFMIGHRSLYIFMASFSAILGGMFGIRHWSEKSRTDRREEFDEMIQYYGNSWKRGTDQEPIL